MVTLHEVLRESFVHGSKSGIGTSPVALTEVSGLTARRGIVVKAAAGNSGFVYVGKSDKVTAGTIDATDGFELSKGDPVTIEVADPAKIFVIASEPGQQVFFIGD